MSSEDAFRFTLLATFCLMTAIVGYHRLQAASSGERISRKDEGLLLAVSLRLAGLWLWAGALLYLVHPAWMAWAQFSIPRWLRWLGAIVVGLFVALIYWSLTSLGKNLTDTVMTRPNATLVTTGPYRFVRHPFYISVGLLLLSVTLLTANWFIGLGGLLVMILLIVRTPKEEQKLVERFGEQYRAYAAKTGRFFPKM